MSCNLLFLLVGLRNLGSGNSTIAWELGAGSDVKVKHKCFVYVQSMAWREKHDYTLLFW